MKSFGHINMQQNELQETVIQVETNFPSLPIPGRLVFKDHILYICIAINSGTPVWIPLTNEIESYEYIQSASSQTWMIQHDLNTTLPSVQVYGADNKVMFPDEIEIISNNSLNVTFTNAATGRAVVLAGNKTGNVRPLYTFEYTQTELSSEWVVVHNLGYHPIVRVFIGNQEVMPMAITHDSNFQVTILFTQPVVGIARLM